MDTQAIDSQAKDIRNKMLDATVPFHEVLRQTWFDLPFAFASEALRFTAHRFRAQGDFFAHLESCQSVPEMIEAQSHFMRKAVGDYETEISKTVGEARKSAQIAA